MDSESEEITIDGPGTGPSDLERELSNVHDTRFHGRRRPRSHTTTSVPISSSKKKTKFRNRKNGQNGVPRYWTPQEHSRFLEATVLFGEKDVRAIAEYVGSRSSVQVRTHAQKYKIRLNRQMEDPSSPEVVASETMAFLADYSAPPSPFSIAQSLPGTRRDSRAVSYSSHFDNGGSTHYKPERPSTPTVPPPVGSMHGNNKSKTPNLDVMGASAARERPASTDGIPPTPDKYRVATAAADLLAFSHPSPPARAFKSTDIGKNAGRGKGVSGIGATVGGPGLPNKRFRARFFSDGDAPPPRSSMAPPNHSQNRNTNNRTKRRSTAVTTTTTTTATGGRSRSGNDGSTVQQLGQEIQLKITDMSESDDVEVDVLSV